MRWFVSVVLRVATTLLASVYVLLIACQSNYTPFAQPEPVSINQELMLSDVRLFEPLLEMGSFIATFQVPPDAGWAGWADCNPAGRPPWYVHFNGEFVESLDPTLRRTYMSALVAHEMCHHWVTRHNGSCHDEESANTCGYNLVTFGRPK